MTDERKELIERLAEHLYGHPRSSAIEWAKEDKFDSCFQQAEEILALVIPSLAATIRADALEEAAKVADEDDHLSGTGDAIRKLIQSPLA